MHSWLLPTTRLLCFESSGISQLTDTNWQQRVYIIPWAHFLRNVSYNIQSFHGTVAFFYKMVEPDLYREQILQVTYGYDLSTQLNLAIEHRRNLRRLSVAYGADRQDLVCRWYPKIFLPLNNWSLTGHCRILN